VPIGKDVPVKVAATLGCSVVTGAGAVFNTANFPEGATAVVIGGGAVGMSVVQALKIKNASLIILVEPDETKWAAAEKNGATHTFSNKPEIPVKETKKLTDDFGVDFAFDCVAVQDTTSASLAMIRRGGTVVVVGSPHPLSKFELPAVDFHLEKKLIGSLYGSSNPQRDIPKILDYYRKGELNL
jgi:S-(hydroxymethyl)glutathione dehydrogenase/alcohol dehydrogenase